MKSFPEFLKELQVSSDSRKSRWVLGASFSSFFFIFVMWGVYLKYQLPSYINAPIITPEMNEITPAPKESLLGTVRLGFSTVVTNLKDLAKTKNILEINSSPSFFPSPSPLPFPKTGEFPNN